MIGFFFFFMQMTAYELRICDWSSDVCSSDLGLVGEVDNRVWQRYGAAFAMASISALSQAGSTATSSQAFGSSANVLSQNLGQVTAKLLDQYLNLRSEERSVGKECISTCRYR